MKPGQHRDHLNRSLLLASIAILASGLLLFTQFHIGHGAHAIVFARISKAYWRDLHRVAALFFLFYSVHHLHIHWRIIKRHLARFKLLQGQVLLLFLFSIVLITGLIGWLVLPGGYNPEYTPRHLCIDIHNLTGIPLTLGLFLHLRRRWRLLWLPNRPRVGKAIPSETKPSGS
ncbi:MAG TPA: DUF4405 domain-containing protein [Candidatus Hydrogenedentes bacterium]|nr:DUF4405 domain-containing protein [Candidatus Hydrogenedentota bacterium]